MKYSSNEDGIEKISAWMRQKGYDTTPDDVSIVCNKFRQEEIYSWMGNYRVNDGLTPRLTIRGNILKINNTSFAIVLHEHWTSCKV